MVRNPNQDKPARPVVAAEHKPSEKSRDQADEAHPDEVVWEGMLDLELSKVVNKSDSACCDEYPADDGHGKGTIVHNV